MSIIFVCLQQQWWWLQMFVTRPVLSLVLSFHRSFLNSWWTFPVFTQHRLWCIRLHHWWRRCVRMRRVDASRHTTNAESKQLCMLCNAVVNAVRCAQMNVLAVACIVDDVVWFSWWRCIVWASSCWRQIFISLFRGLTCRQCSRAGRWSRGWRVRVWLGWHCIHSNQWRQTRSLTSNTLNTHSVRSN